MNIFIENPSCTKLKKEFEKGKWFTIGNLAVAYPYPYGFIPGTMQKDGDPLDAFLITANPSKIKRGDFLDTYVLGMVEYLEDGERDSKILAKSPSENIELNQNIKAAIKNFLLHAFDNKPGKRVEFNGFHDKAEAENEIRNTITAYNGSSTNKEK